MFFISIVDIAAPNETKIKPPQGAAITSLKLHRNGAVGFIVWLGPTLYPCLGRLGQDKIAGKGRSREFGAFQTRRRLIMKKLIPIVGMSVLALVVARAQDPAKVDPKHYKVIFNNPQVRVLDVRLKPGEKTPVHSHPNLVVYSLTGGTIKSTTADGKTTTVTTKAGQVGWRDAQTHTSENVGKTEIHSLGIELKK